MYSTEYRYNVILHSPLQWLTHNVNQSLDFTKYTPYPALMDELWGAFCEDFGENWPRYNSTALYMETNTWHVLTLYLAYDVVNSKIASSSDFRLIAL